MENYFIVRKIKDDPVLTIFKSSDVKPKMIELNRKIGHNSVMSIREFFIDRDEPARLVDQVIHDMEVIGYTSAEGGNGMGQLFASVLLIYGPAVVLVSVYMPFFHG